MFFSPPPACFRQQTALQIGERRGSLGSVWKQEGGVII